MPKKKMWVEWDDDADLSQSRKKPGDFSPLTRDRDKNLGHATLSEIDDDEEDYEYTYDPPDGPRPLSPEEEEAAAALAALLIIAIQIAAEKAAPHIKRWWNDRARPFMSRMRNRLSRNRPSAPPEETAVSQPAALSSPRLDAQMSVVERVMLSEPAAEEPPQEVFVALDQYRASMSSSEARERLAAAIVARLYSEEQLRRLRDARIEDDGPGLVLANAMERFTPQELEETIRLMLEAHPSWPDNSTLAELERVIEARGRADGEHARVDTRPQLP